MCVGLRFWSLFLDEKVRDSYNGKAYRANQDQGDQVIDSHKFAAFVLHQAFLSEIHFIGFS